MNDLRKVKRTRSIRKNTEKTKRKRRTRLVDTAAGQSSETDQRVPVNQIPQKRALGLGPRSVTRAVQEEVGPEAEVILLIGIVTEIIGI